MSEPKIALITGANKGIGFHVARKLGASGVHVLVGSRNADRGESAAATLRSEGIAADALVLDVTKSDVIASAAEHVKAKHGRLDILVNNAGIAPGSAPPSKVSVDEMRAAYETNVFGVVAVTNAFLPLLRLSPAPRIVNVSSGLGSLGMMSDPASRWYALIGAAYPTSKSALDALTIQYAKELRDTPFKVNVICPGYRATDLAGPGVNASRGASDPAGAADIVLKMALLGPDGPTGQFFDSAGAVNPW